MKKLINKLFQCEALSFADRRDIVKRTRARYGLDRRVASSFGTLSLSDKINGLMAYKQTQLTN